MNLYELGSEVFSSEELSLVKVGPRKSAAQPHLWLLCDEQKPRAVVKFAPAGHANARAWEKVDREARFLQKVRKLPSSHFLRRDVPELLLTHEDAGGRAVVVRFDPRPLSRDWVLPRFRKEPMSLVTWLGDRLAWLQRLQTDPALRERWEVPESSVLQHGDFGPYNMLGGPGETPLIIDWEDWATTDEPFHDALHLAVLPTLAEQSEETARRSFRRHWIEGSDWSRAFREKASVFLPDDLDGRGALERYLCRQLDSTEPDAEGIRRIFELALDELRR